MTIRCPCSPTGRGPEFKIPKVGVQVPSWAHTHTFFTTNNKIMDNRCYIIPTQEWGKVTDVYSVGDTTYVTVNAEREFLEQEVVVMDIDELSELVDPDTAHSIHEDSCQRLFRETIQSLQSEILDRATNGHSDIQFQCQRRFVDLIADHLERVGYENVRSQEGTILFDIPQ